MGAEPEHTGESHHKGMGGRVETTGGRRGGQSREAARDRHLREAGRLHDRLVEETPRARHDEVRRDLVVESGHSPSVGAA